MNEDGNTRILRTCYEKFASGDISGMIEHFADDVELFFPEIENAPYHAIWHGRVAVAGFLNLLTETEEITDFEDREYIAMGDRVAVLGRYTATVRATGRHYSTEWVHIHTVRNDRITSFSIHFDTAAALRAFQKVTRALN